MNGKSGSQHRTLAEQDPARAAFGLGIAVLNLHDCEYALACGRSSQHRALAEQDPTRAAFELGVAILNLHDCEYALACGFPGG